MRANIFKTSNGSDISPAEVIKHHRRNMIIHSYLYYVLNETVISDDKWQEIANELVELQQAFPEPIGYFDEEFKGWTGDTGMHLPQTKLISKGEYLNSWIHDDALYILRLSKS